MEHEEEDNNIYVDLKTYSMEHEVEEVVKVIRKTAELNSVTETVELYVFILEPYTEDMEKLNELNIELAKYIETSLCRPGNKPPSCILLEGKEIHDGRALGNEENIIHSYELIQTLLRELNDQFIILQQNVSEHIEEIE